MTEEEAQTKWCPFARVDSTASNRGDHIGFNRASDPCCVGSACMAWRPIVSQQTWLVTLDDKPEEAWSWNPVDSGSYAGRVQVRKADALSSGFCGLAGATP